MEASKTAQNDIKKWEEIGVWQATPKKSNDAVGLGIGDGLNSAALPYNHGTYLIENHSHLAVHMKNIVFFTNFNKKIRFTL